MKKEIIESFDIPAGISCEVKGRKLICKKDSVEMSRILDVPTVAMEVKDSKIILSCKKGSKREFKVMKSFIAHVENIFKGLNKKFVYNLEACNLHFPMTLKMEKGTLLINNKQIFWEIQRNNILTYCEGNNLRNLFRITCLICNNNFPYLLWLYGQSS